MGRKRYSSVIGTFAGVEIQAFRIAGILMVALFLLEIEVEP